MKKVLIVLSLLAGCTTNQTTPTPQSKTTSTVPASSIIPPTPTVHVPLWWENTTVPHPERASWSDQLVREIRTNFPTLKTAKDMADFCPKFSTLDEKTQIKVWSELMVAIAYYESGFDPKNASVDVGTEGNKDSYSVGLWQVSVIDQQSSGLNFGLKYDDLLTVEGNTKLAMAIMTKQIKNKRLINVPWCKFRGNCNGTYWATLSKGNPYDKSTSIAVRVQKQVAECK